MQVLPQYRNNDRKIKKEQYDNCLRLIQDLIDCDDFEDISTLRVSLDTSVLRKLFENVVFVGCDRLAGSQQLWPGRQTLSDRRQDRVQAGSVDSQTSFLQWDSSGDHHASPDQQVARAAGPHHLILPSNPREQEDGDNLLWWSNCWASPGGGSQSISIKLDVPLFNVHFSISVTIYWYHLVTQKKLILYLAGCNKFGNSSNMPHLHDGETHHHGPVETGCWPHGGEDHTSHLHLQKLQTHHTRVCLSEGGGHGHDTRR